MMVLLQEVGAAGQAPACRLHGHSILTRCVLCRGWVSAATAALPCLSFTLDCPASLYGTQQSNKHGFVYTDCCTVFPLPPAQCTLKTDSSSCAVTPLKFGIWVSVAGLALSMWQ